MHLLFVLYTGSNSHNTGSLIGLAKEALATGDRVTIFAMADGAGNLAREDFIRLIDDGANITVCEHNREEIKAPVEIDGVKYGSQYDLAQYVVDCDRVVSFT